MLAILAPGQGAQRPGMLTPWRSRDTGDLLAELSERAGVDLTELGTVADAPTIRDTANAQPLLVTASIVALHALGWVPTEHRGALVAGHSVGEFSAAVAAGVLTPPDAVGLVAQRGRAMASAASLADTGMAAVVGGNEDEIAQRLGELSLVGANHNGAGQLVIAGSSGDLARFAANPPARARVIPLDVAGAFHSAYMQPALAPLTQAAQAVTFADPALTWLGDADAEPLATGSDVRRALVAQVTAPVRWDLIQAELAARGVTGVLELPPTGVLTGLAKRTLPQAERFALSLPEDVPAALEFIARHDVEPAV